MTLAIEFMKFVEAQRDQPVDLLLDRILLKCRLLLGAEAGTIYLIEEPSPGKPRIRPVSLQNDVVDMSRIELGLDVDEKSLAGHVARAGESIRIDDAYTPDPGRPFRFNYDVDRQTGYRTVSVLAFPLKTSSGNVTGVVQLINRRVEGEDQPVPFDESHATLIQPFNELVGQAIERTVLLDQLRAANNELRRQSGHLTRRVSEHVQREEVLRTSEAWYRTLFEDLKYSICVEDWSRVRDMVKNLRRTGLTDWDGYFDQHPELVAKAYDMVETIQVNKATLDMYKAPDVETLVALDSAEDLSEQELGCFRQQLVCFAEGSTSFATETEERALDGTAVATQIQVIIPPEYRDTWSRVLRAVEDITHRKRTEEQLHQAQKMEAVGQLTGGVAHDFNNLLAVVLGNLELARENITGSKKGLWPRRRAELLKLLSSAMLAVNRGAHLTQRLLAFSRKQTLKPEPVDLRTLVDGMGLMLRRTLGETTEINIVSADGLWACEADPGQLESALLNLAINARDAMPKDGKLTIETINTHLDDDYAAAQADVPPGDYVVLSVTDTGAGMSKAVLQRAFEPFFTTKEVGKGSGLGLSMIYGFAKQSGGHVTIYSEEGIGTTVRLYLPKAERKLRLVKAQAVVAEPKARGETILVVEDDPELRTVAVTLLGDLGYDVLEAGSGKAALSALHDNSRVHLLFTDVVLPGGISGPDIATAAQRTHPGIKVLYMSGYTENALVRQDRVEHGVAMLSKPFRKRDLAKTVRSALEAHVA